MLLFQLLTIHRVVFLFGWAKPVPVSAWKFRDPRRGMMVVAAAGPAMNFFLAWLAALLLPRRPLPGGLDYFERACAAPAGGVFPFYFILTNLVLGPVQPAADPASRWRSHRGRPAAAGRWRGAGRSSSGPASWS